MECIIFDLDGLLVDSEPLQYKAYNQVFEKYGHPISESEWIHWSQNSYSAKRWIEKNNLSLDPEVIRAEKKKIYDGLIQTDLVLKEGAEYLVKLLSKHYPLCLASSSRIESIEACLAKFHFTDNFTLIESGAGMSRSKPYPDIYLKVASDMKIEPPQCLVLENSIAGLNAAKSAGMKCIICPDVFDDIQAPDFQKADFIVSSLGEITLETISSI